jgi:hypothetical protein
LQPETAVTTMSAENIHSHFVACRNFETIFRF